MDFHKVLSAKAGPRYSYIKANRVGVFSIQSQSHWKLRNMGKTCAFATFRCDKHRIGLALGFYGKGMWGKVVRT